MQAMVELGFLVVQIDGMGTSNRSKAFHDVCGKNFAHAGFPDRVLWHKAAAAKHPGYDIFRVGIYGHSAGCHDNRIDKISWNEQWQGWPVGPEYAASSNVDHASTLQVVNPLIKAQK